MSARSLLSVDAQDGRAVTVAESMPDGCGSYRRPPGRGRERATNTPQRWVGSATRRSRLSHREVSGTSVMRPSD